MTLANFHFEDSLLHLWRCTDTWRMAILRKEDCHHAWTTGDIA